MQAKVFKLQKGLVRPYGCGLYAFIEVEREREIESTAMDLLEGFP